MAQTFARRYEGKSPSAGVRLCQEAFVDISTFRVARLCREEHSLVPGRDPVALCQMPEVLINNVSLMILLLHGNTKAQPPSARFWEAFKKVDFGLA